MKLTNPIIPTIKIDKENSLAILLQYVFYSKTNKLLIGTGIY